METRTEQHDLAVRAVELHHSFGDVAALQGLDLSLPTGQLCGLIGPDGAGKTTLLRILCGLIAAARGTVTVLGYDPWREAGRLRRKLGYAPQRFALYPDLSVAENLRFYADLYDVREPARTARLDRLLEFSRLGPFARRRAQNLSGGMRQKLALACSLIHSPALLLLDEPTTGVDPVSRRELWGLLREIVAGGTTILVSTPYMDEAARCDTVSLVAHGHCLAAGTPPGLVASYPWQLIDVLTTEPVRARTACREIPGILDAHALGDRLHLAVHDADAVMAQLPAVLAGAGIPPGAMRMALPSMEDLFVCLFRSARSSSSTGEAAVGMGVP